MIRINNYNRRDLKAEINIIPLLDVLLVILLIFMSTTPIVTGNVEVDLPSSSNSKTISSDKNISMVIEISGIGQYGLIVNHNHVKQLSSEQIISEVQSYLKKDAKAVLLIGGAKDIPYEEIIKILSLVQKAGAKSVGLMTQPI